MYHISNEMQPIKGACSENIWETELFIKLADMVTFQNNISSKVKK